MGLLEDAAMLVPWLLLLTSKVGKFELKESTELEPGGGAELEL
jgi:hypothetical protein